MTDLPPGWEWATLGDVAVLGSGGTPKAGRSELYGGSIPWAVIGDLNDSTVSTTRSSITAEGLRRSSAKLVPAGSVLIAMYGSIGKLGLNSIELATNQAIAFAQPILMEARYLFWFLMASRRELEESGKGAAQRNISQTILRSWPIPVAPLAEQHRIVTALEDHVSRIDAGMRSLANCQSLQRLLARQAIIDAVDGVVDAKIVTVAEVGAVDLGRQRHPDWHTGSNMRPYLRVANVFEDRIDLDDVKEMDFPPEVFQRFELKPEDILLNEGQSPEYLGRPARYQGEPGRYAFTNSLLRFRAHPGVLPEWALLVFRRHMHAGRFMKESRITTNIAHLSATRFKGVEFPLPSPLVQARVVAEAHERLAEIDRLSAAIDLARTRASELRRSLLAEAFTGRLVPQDPDDEPASVLLERIRAERAAQPKSRRGRSKAQ